MKWLNKLERKIGKYAISNLMYYVIVLYIIGIVLDFANPYFYYEYLALDANAILNGEIWRIVTFLFKSPVSISQDFFDILLAIVALYLFYSLGRQLEYTWGKFRFNFYFMMGVLLHVIATLLAYLLFDKVYYLGTYHLSMALIFAYAVEYPNQEFLLFMAIPVKAKWLAWIDAALFGYTILQGFLPEYGGSWLVGWYYQAEALAAFVSILNFVLFYLISRRRGGISAQDRKRKQAYHKKIREARKENQYENGAKHRCAVCGRTELDHPNLEFRYCSKCNGNYEYCQDHLFTHEHVK